MDWNSDAPIHSEPRQGRPENSPACKPGVTGRHRAASSLPTARAQAQPELTKFALASAEQATPRIAPGYHIPHECRIACHDWDAIGDGVGRTGNQNGRVASLVRACVPANENLERDIAELLPRPVGRPSKKPLVEYKGFLYQAESWKTARRVVAKVEHHPGELFPRVGFIVTNLALPSRAVVRFYNKRGTAEQWIKEGKQAVKMTRLICHRFRSNEVRLWLAIIAYNLGNLWRRLVLPKKIEKWSLTSLQQRLVKTGGRLIKHARYYWLLLAESHLTQRLFASMVRRIESLPVPAG